MKSIKIYLSGSIQKGNTDTRSPDHFWTEADERLIRKGLGGHIELLNPAKTKIRRNDYSLNFGCDLYLVSISDIVLVDARHEKGLGIGAEMMFASERGIPVVTWAPPNTHYRRDFVPDVFGEDLYNWTHPFIFGLSDRIVESLEEGVAAIHDYFVGLWRPSNDYRKHISRYVAETENGNGNR